MKFSHIKAFEKHVESADPAHLSSLYVLIDPEEYVQKRLAKSLIIKGQEVREVFPEDLTLSKLNEVVDMMPMFAQSQCLIFYRIDQLLKPLQKRLYEIAKSTPSHLRLVLCASTMPRDFASLHKEGVILDLVSEKPWDKEKRLSFDVREKLHQNQLRIASALADQLVKMCAMEVSKIDHELEKLICFLRGKKEVSRSDLSLISSSDQHSIFKVSEALLESRIQDAIAITEKQRFPLMVLVYSIRSAIQKALRLQQLSPKEAAEQFPKLRGSFLEKNIRLSKLQKRENLKKMLQVLFEVEVLMKSQPVAESFLSSLLLTKLGALCESVPV